MRIVDQRYLDEDNRYASQPCLLSILELDDTLAMQPAAMASFHRRLLAALPGLKHLRGLVGRRGAAANGGVAAESNVPYLARLTQQVAIELQRLACGELVVGFVAPVPKMKGRYRLVLPYRARHVAESALALATRLLDALLAGRSFDLADGLRRLRQPAAA